jgi:hypothetical protein
MNTDMPYFEKVLDDCVTAVVEHGENITACLLQYPEQQHELEPLLNLVTRLRAAHTLEPSPEFSQVTLTRMHNLIAARPRQVEPVKVWRWPRLELYRKRTMALVTAVVIFICLFISGGVVRAAADTLPGDTLYPVKRAAEATQIALSINDANDTRLHIRFANRRLEEAAALLQNNHIPQAKQAAADYETQIQTILTLLESSSLTAAEQTALANQLISETEEHQTKLARLLEQAVPDARSTIELTMKTAQSGYDQALTILGQSPEKEPPAIIATPTHTATPSPRPATATPEPTTAGPTVTATPTPTWTPRPTWEIPPAWPPECPTPPDWPDEWPADCPFTPEELLEQWPNLMELWPNLYEKWSELPKWWRTRTPSTPWWYVTAAPTYDWRMPPVWPPECPSPPNLPDEWPEACPYTPEKLLEQWPELFEQWPELREEWASLLEKWGWPNGEWPATPPIQITPPSIPDLPDLPPTPDLSNLPDRSELPTVPSIPDIPRPGQN